MKRITLPAIAGLCAIVVVAPVQASEALAKKAGCTVCHATDKKLVGPSFHDIAVKYKGRPDALTFLSQQVRKGSKGTWGPVPMPPNDAAKISDADLKAVIEWLLKS